MNDKVIFISGASAGLGKAIALQLKEKGATVIGTSRNPDQHNLPFELVKMDLEQSESIETAIKTAVDKAGHIDVLINNAGIGIMGPLEHQQLETIDKAWRINITGNLLLTKTVAPFMRQNGGGKILNISSLAGVLGLPYRTVWTKLKNGNRILPLRL